MCGSGTLLIEAAMMAADIAPGLLRKRFGFHCWKQFDQDQWQKILSAAEEKKQQGMQSLPIICGSDNSEQLVAIARSNITAAGLSSVIKVTLQDATTDLTPFKGMVKQGLIVTNPPYGQRIVQLQFLRTLYHRFGVQ